MVLDAVIVVVISRAEATEPNDTTHFMDYNTQLMKTPCGVIHLKINNCRVKGGTIKWLFYYEAVTYIFRVNLLPISLLEILLSEEPPVVLKGRHAWLPGHVWAGGFVVPH